MIEQSLLIKLSSPGIIDDTTSRLRQEYRAYQSLYQAQPADVQQFISTQAAKLAEAIDQGKAKVQFYLPEVVAPGLREGDSGSARQLLAADRKQSAGGWLMRLTHTSLLSELTQRLGELAGSSNQALSEAAELLRYAVAVHMVYSMLPAGNPVTYAIVEGDDIPNQPVAKEVERVAVNEEKLSELGVKTRIKDDERGMMAACSEKASHFFLPQWVAFDDDGQLLAGSMGEAEAHITSLRHYLAILNLAITLAPYMIADEVWQQKRYGALGQLVNQGRAMANYELQGIILEICRRVEAHKLDRGLSLSLPYFDDQKLALSNYKFSVIPYGMVMFVPAFLVLAAREQQIKVAGDTSLSLATRRHLLSELNTLERAFLR